MTQRFDDGRYRIVDEPKRIPLGGLAQPLLLFLLPITLYLALTVNLFFFLLPGALGLLIGGKHFWFDPLLSASSIVIFVTGSVISFVALDYGLSETGYDYALSVCIALAALPLFFIIQGQHRTLVLRAAMKQ